MKQIYQKSALCASFQRKGNWQNAPLCSAPKVTKYQGEADSRRGKKRTLEDLFKPPIDIIFKGDLQTARDSATSAKKWLLVNIQDASEFQCQVLNRDVWSNEAVKTILRHNLF